MQDLNLISEGTRLAIVGMSTVFFFLTALVITTGLMSRVVNLIESKKDSHAFGPTTDKSTEEEIAKVVAVAVHIHKNRRPVS